MKITYSIKNLFVCVVLLCGLSPALAQKPANKPKDIPLSVQALTITTHPINVFTPLVSNGRLEFIGGLDLGATVKGFGGFSALALDTTGTKALAVSDGGLWMSFDLISDNDKPLRIDNAKMAPLRDKTGASLAGSGKGDAESIALQNGMALIGFEQTDAIWQYDYAQHGLEARAQAADTPDDIKSLRYSRGLETLASFPHGSRYAGSVLAIGESPVRGEQHNRGWIIDGKNFRRLTVIARDGFQITDAGFLSSGNLVLLERRFTPPFDLSMRLREIKGADIAGGARLDGDILLEARLAAPIDNMEGLAVHKGADGRDVITLISDDNFNVFQRTLLLRFRYSPSS